MTVKKLIAELSKLPQNALVILAADEEGNSFKTAVDVHATNFDKKSGEIGLSELTEDLIHQGYTEEDLAPEDAVPAVVIWP